MQSLHSKLSGIAPFVFFPFLIIFKKKKRTAYLLICFLILTLSGCYLNFYRTNTKSSIDASTISGLNSRSKYFIVHFANSTNELENVYVNNDSLYGTILPLSPVHSKNLHPLPENPKNKVRGSKKSALIEVHLYTSENLNGNDSLFATSLNSFNRADVYELNSKATTNNHILSTVGVILTTVVVGIVILSSFFSSSPSTPPPNSGGDCNCPQVYMENNGTYNFTSGLYSGAVYSTLERTDYLPLTSISTGEKNISFKIANAKNEEQFINKVELLQVNHLNNVNVLTDRHGNILSYKKPIVPTSAVINNKDDVKEVLNEPDKDYYSFDNSANKDGFSDIKLTFDKPKGADNVKLVIHARNTYWGGLLHKEFINLFGDDFDKWRTKQEASNPKDLEKWQTDQALPLMVYIKENNEWKFVDYFQLIGNTASRDMIMQINTKNIAGDKIELKLETVYRFWDLDYAGIDYSNNQNFTSTFIEPTQAIKSDSTDENATLKNIDKQYVHLVNDEFISFKYSIPPSTANTETSYFLVSCGYYHTLEHITGKADYTKLLKFKKQGGFDKFSREKYKEVRDVADIMNKYNNQQ